MGFPRFNPVTLLWVARRDWPSGAERLAATGEPVLRAGRLPLLVVQDPDAARHVLVADASSYGRPWFVRSIMGDALGRTTFLTDGDEWLARRQRVAPVFGRNHVDGLAHIMATTIRREIAAWPAGTAADIQHDLTELTLRVACRALLGADPADDDLAGEARDRFAVILAWMARRFTHPLAPPAAVPTPRNRRMRAARAGLERAVREMIRRRRATSEGGMDVLSLLLAHQGGVGGPSDDEVVAECIGFLFAGHETTASTLTWGLYELSRHPLVQDEVAQEGSRLDLDRPDLFAAVEELPHTRGVVDEILRMYPAGIGIARACTAPTELLGRRVRRGTTVVVSVYGMQRGSAWDRPDEFRPGRIIPAQPAQRGGAGYLPFGWGPRRCLGARVAETEARLALALICARWRVAYEGASPPKAAVLPALRVDGPLALTLARRVPAPA